MRTLFNQEAVWEIERYNVHQEGRQEGRQEEFVKGVRSMRKAGLDDAKIASLLERDVADVKAVK